MKFILKHGSLMLVFLVFIFAIFATIQLLPISLTLNKDNSLVLLANQFIHRHISLEAVEGMPIGDISKFNGKFYLYFGPFASMVLAPFVFIFGISFPQIAIGITTMIFSLFAVYQLTKTFGFKRIDALWLSLFFVFSTVLFSSSVINITAYQVEVLGVPLILFALLEYFTKKRPLIIGLFLGFAFLTRATLGFAALFFFLEWIQKRLTFKQIFFIALPMIGAVLLFGIYNIARFQSFFDTGYLYNITLSSYPLSQNLQHGYMSVVHIPANLYSFLIMPPEPLLQNVDGFVLKFPYMKINPWGLAIWFTSPLFILLVTQFKSNKYTRSLLITLFSLALPVFTYYSIGFSQFGYRYALDFLPFLFLLLLPCLGHRLSKITLFLITIGILFNCVFLLSAWGIYPLLGIYQ